MEIKRSGVKNWKDKGRVKRWNRKKKKEYALSLMPKVLASIKVTSERKIKKYVALGQFKDGRFYCKSGQLIDDVRVSNYNRLCHYLVQKCIKAKRLSEAAFDYGDLVNQCKREVFLALLNGFDPVKAMTSNEKDPEKKLIREEEKRKDPKKALKAAEKLIVYGRIKNYLRRTLFEYHPDQRGGRTISLEAWLISNPDSNEYHLFDSEKFRKHFDQRLVSDSILRDRDVLMAKYDISPDEARRQFFEMDEGRRSDLEEYLKSFDSEGE